jgi:hypothetical protein
MFEAKPTTTLAQARTVLLGSADLATDSTDPAVIARIRLGAGRLNVQAAVQAAEILQGSRAWSRGEWRWHLVPRRCVK